MAQHLKRWESPRKEGRNDKGRGGSARQRQLQKRQQVLRKRLSGQAQTPGTSLDTSTPGEPTGSLFCALKMALARVHRWAVHPTIFILGLQRWGCCTGGMDGWCHAEADLATPGWAGQTPFVPTQPACFAAGVCNLDLVLTVQEV